MSKSGPIVIVEDDIDDKELLEDALRELDIANELRHFTRCPDALEYLKTTYEQPFLILSDVNLPGQSGIEFKKQIDSDSQLREKSIPFIFFSTSIDAHTVKTAYTEMTVQGFFQKCYKYEDFKNLLKIIMNYWLVCRHPNSES